MRRIALLIGAAVVAIAGCNRGPQFAAVEGMVSKGGAPLKNVQVEFWPTTDGPKSTAVTDDQGRYVLKSEDGTQTGAVVGKHKVLLRDLNLLGDKFLGRKAENVPNMNPGAKERFAKSYSDPTHADLTKDVAAGQTNKIDIEVK